MLSKLRNFEKIRLAQSPNECPVYDTEQSDGESFSNSAALGNVECSFTIIAPRSTLPGSENTW